MRALPLLVAVAALACACGPKQRRAEPVEGYSATGPTTSEPKPDPWVDCYAGLSYVGNPRTDIARVTKTCGSIGGMRAITPVTLGAQTQDDPVDRYTFYVPKAGQCYRVFAAGDSGVKDLDVALRGPEGDELIADLSHDAQPIVPPTGPVCFQSPGLYMLEVSVYRGSGRYAVQVWGGATRQP